jgi:two-component system sensor histidine kinase BaeS
VDGTTVFVEERALARGGGVVLVQRRADAVAPEKRALRRIALALVIAGALAAILGLLVAWRLARPLRRTAAAAHALAAGHRDVTLPAQGPAEIVEVSDAINGLAGALRTSEARQRQFLLSVSHDLRTPLTSITGYAESLAEGVIPPEEAARAGGVLLGEAKRLERLVGDLLDLARLGAQDFRVELAPVDLAALAGAAAAVWEARCAAAGVGFRLEAPAAPVWASTDANRLRQVLDGLFDNALRVTPAGAPIVLAVRPEAEAAVAEVRDGGPGLTDADLAVAFEQGALYERYRGVRQVGTGLGLAIVAALVHRLGGAVEAGHAPEGGARFTVRLPLTGG